MTHKTTSRHMSCRLLTIILGVATIAPLALALGCGPSGQQAPGKAADDPSTQPAVPEEDVASDQTSNDDEEGGEVVPFEEGKADGASTLGGHIEFSRACEEGERLTIAAVGDLLLHGSLQKQAYREESGFASLWSGVADLLATADVTYANLEGPTAAGVGVDGKLVADPGATFDDYVYTSYPRFNYHPRLLSDLVSSGVDVVSTANNHSLDRRSVGADRTIDALEEVGLPYTGTHRRDGGEQTWHTLTKSGGFRLAWLACTFSTNGISDTYDQVLDCYADADEIEDHIRALAAASDVDAVIITPHWGVEYVATPKRSQVDLAHRFLDAGATVVIGGHPHVLEPWEKHRTPDGRETFVIYSLGNFVSGQSGLAKRSSMILYVGLTRAEGGKAFVNGIRYVPLYMLGRESGNWQAVAIDRASGNSGLASSRRETVKMFGTFNLQPLEEPVVTQGQCPG